MSVWYHPELDEIGVWNDREGILLRKRCRSFWSKSPMTEAGWQYIGEL